MDGDIAGASGALSERLAWYHQAAGTALAPYVLNAPVPGLAGDRAFLPENVHEATYHFATGFSLAQRARARLGSGETGERQRLVDAIYASGSRQLRFATTASWMTVVNLTKLQRLSKSRDAYLMGRALLDNARQGAACHVVHPIRYLSVIRAGARWRKAVGPNTPEEIATRTQLDDQLIGHGGLFDQALQACEHPELATELAFNLLVVKSEYAQYLAEVMGSPPERQQQLATLDRDVRRVLSEGAERVDGSGVKGEWYERIGDAAPDHAHAAAIYKLGLRWVPQWYQLWVKALGASVLAGETTEWVSGLLRSYASQLDEDQPGTSEATAEGERGVAELIATKIRSLRKYEVRQRRRPPPRWTSARWETGLRYRAAMDRTAVPGHSAALPALARRLHGHGVAIVAPAGHGVTPRPHRQRLALPQTLRCAASLLAWVAVQMPSRRAAPGRPKHSVCWGLQGRTCALRAQVFGFLCMSPRRPVTHAAGGPRRPRHPLGPPSDSHPVLGVSPTGSRTSVILVAKSAAGGVGCRASGPDPAGGGVPGRQRSGPGRRCPHAPPATPRARARRDGPRRPRRLPRRQPLYADA